MHAVIMAGGKGTRLTDLTKDQIPKPMALVCGKPILQHQIEVLKRNGITSIIIIAGYMHEKITAFFKGGKDFGVSIEYIIEETPLGTAGSFYFLKGRIQEDFLLILGDVVFDIDVGRMIDFHKEKSSLATLFTHPNSHPFDSDILIVEQNTDKVVGFDSKKNVRDYYYENCVNAGIYMFSPRVFDYVTALGKLDLEKDIILRLINEYREIYSYSSSEYVKDVGTPQRLERAEEDMLNGIVKKRCLAFPQKCIFLDRDGTINVEKNFLHRHEDFELESTVVDAIKKINSSEYICVVVTNQPVVARNLCTIEELGLTHRKMYTLLGNQGVYVDGLYFCPHHPDKGYEGENAIFKIECNCRKPKTGMIMAAQERFNIDLSCSWIIGDTTIDIQTGVNAGLKTILLKTGYGGKDEKFDVKPDFVCESLTEAVDIILK